jgi:transposase
MTTKKKFTPEFKQETANLVLLHDYSCRQAAEAVGASESAVQRWVVQIRAENAGQTPKSKAISPEHQRIQLLEKRIKQLEMEKDILKKASALLMLDEFKNIT